MYVHVYVWLMIQKKNYFFYFFFFPLFSPDLCLINIIIDEKSIILYFDTLLYSTISLLSVKIFDCQVFNYWSDQSTEIVMDRQIDWIMQDLSEERLFVPITWDERLRRKKYVLTLEEHKINNGW